MNKPRRDSHPLRAAAYTTAGLMLGATVLFAFADWAKKDPSAWTDSDVRAILTDSPWTKDAKLNFAGNMGGGQPGGAGRGGGGNWGGGGGGGMGGGGMGTGGGGMGASGGMGGGGYGRQGGMGGGQPGGGQPERLVTLQWVSAAPVRFALAKRQAAGQPVAEGAPDFSKPMDQYVLAVSGFPNGGGRGGGGGWNHPDSDQSSDTGVTGDRPKRDPAQMAEKLKANSALNRKGHDPIHPDNVTWDDSNGSRVMMLFFPKTEPITLADKDVEVEISMGPMEIKKKFALKDMVYQGKLEL